MEKDLQIIFIGGSGRSGTNITKDILSRHSLVGSLPFEYRFIIDPGGIIDYYTSLRTCWSPFHADYKIKKLKAFLRMVARKNSLHYFLSNIVKRLNPSGKIFSPQSYFEWRLEEWIPNISKYLDELIEELTDFEYSGCWPGATSYSFKYKVSHSKYKEDNELAYIFRKFLRKCIFSYLQSIDRKIFVEDNTWNILFAKQLFEILPEGKLIHVYRDPRDVIASYVRQRWCPSHVENATEWYLSIMKKWFSVKKELEHNKYYELKLEDLIEKPAKTLKDVCKFTNLEFQKRLLDVDLSKLHKERWKTDFTRKEQSYINKTLKTIILELGYTSG